MRAEVGDDPLRPRPHMYVVIFGTWLAALAWFHPRLVILLDAAHGPVAWGALLFFIVFTELAWLYGFYNIGVVIFAMIYRAGRRAGPAARQENAARLPASLPAVAILYTTCNDFVEASAASCVAQDYPNFTVYLLDDSNDPDVQARVNAFATAHTGRVRVIRRATRRGFKAGNINHALAAAATTEPLFALVDADELLPPDFLRRLVPRLLAGDRCGFVQANHRSNPDVQGSLPAALGVGIDIHWRWYQPLRNSYGFVMLLGHGAVLRRRCWEEVGGFPEIVSEDLAYALRIRERGWRGQFAEDVVCYEDFPKSIRAFRVRHMKWTRGTCEFLVKEMSRAMRSRRISLVEKLDVLFPTLSLPLSLFCFLFIVDANLVLFGLFGRSHPVTLMLAGREFTVPNWGLDPIFTAVASADFFLITVLTFIAPILCFIIDLARTPGRLFRFLCRSSTVYAALGPLSSIGVLSFLATGQAKFYVTGDQGSQKTWRGELPLFERFKSGARHLLSGSHPDHPVVQGFEILCGVVFGVMCVMMVQVSLFGLAVAFVLMPVLHHVSWEHPLMQRLIYLPFVLILAGISLGGLGLLGVQPVFFGYGFHF